jgi:gamma-glutamyltranspeptidase/glutathione hydrolase
MFFCDGIKFMSLDPKHPNFAEPNKRMRKNLSPALVFDSNSALVLAIGAAGGTTIWQTVTQSIVNVLDLKQNVQQAITSPRVAYAAPGVKLSIDNHFAPEVLQALHALGYEVRGDTTGESVGAVQGIAFDPKTHAMSGGADPRRDGKPAAY